MFLIDYRVPAHWWSLFVSPILSDFFHFYLFNLGAGFADHNQKIADQIDRDTACRTGPRPEFRLRHFSAWQNFNDGGACQMSLCNIEINQWIKELLYCFFKNKHQY